MSLLVLVAYCYLVYKSIFYFKFKYVDNWVLYAVFFNLWLLLGLILSKYLPPLINKKFKKFKETNIPFHIIMFTLSGYMILTLMIIKLLNIQF